VRPVGRYQPGQSIGPIEMRAADSHARAVTDRLRRTRPIEACRFCGGNLLTSVFDTAFRDTAAEERLFFAVPGALCLPCRQLYVDQQLIGILGLDGARCTFAIESDRVLRTNQAGAA
jgi:hypothetical protein